MITSIICDSIILVLDFISNFIDNSIFAHFFNNIDNYIPTIIDIAQTMRTDILPVFYYFIPIEYFAPLFIMLRIFIGIRITFAVVNLIWP